MKGIRIVATAVFGAPAAALAAARLIASAKRARWRAAQRAARLDAFCAGLNQGLLAVALVLSLSVAATFLYRHADSIAPIMDPETGEILSATTF